MERREFIAGSALAGAALPAEIAGAAPFEEFTAGSAPGPVLAGAPVVSGPAPESITIIQPVQRHATGWLEFSAGNGPFERVDASAAGLLPFEPHALKFRLPPLPPGAPVRYRVTARSIGWVRFRGFTYGKIEPGPPEVGPERSFRALDPAADRTRFVVWNDTHENAATLQSLHRLTEAAAPDFLLWNGDQSNDIHEESTMTAQFLAPAGLAIADRRPLAYVRGNHDVRGPAARRLTQFTGTPGDRYYYGFRSGPLAALVLDTGEDKPDDSVWLGGLTDFAALRREQAAWLAKVVREPWFTSAPYRVLFCHIPLWFTRELKAEWAEYSKPCRDAWLPTLVAAGVKLVISGHTHAPAWMPAKADQPIAQLIGGGPRPAQATILHGDADRRRLRLELRRLDGSLVHEAAVPA